MIKFVKDSIHSNCYDVMIFEDVNDVIFTTKIGYIFLKDGYYKFTSSDLLDENDLLRAIEVLRLADKQLPKE